jgi:hypothetical protein
VATTIAWILQARRASLRQAGKRPDAQGASSSALSPPLPLPRTAEGVQVGAPEALRESSSVVFTASFPMPHGSSTASTVTTSPSRSSTVQAFQAVLRETAGPPAASQEEWPERIEADDGAVNVSAAQAQLSLIRRRPESPRPVPPPAVSAIASAATLTLPFHSIHASPVRSSADPRRIGSATRASLRAGSKGVQRTDVEGRGAWRLRCWHDVRQPISRGTRSRRWLEGIVLDPLRAGWNSRMPAALQVKVEALLATHLLPSAGGNSHQVGARPKS